MTKIESSASFLKALGHPVRLLIARDLLEGQKCVGEIESSMNIRQANASQHLLILRTNGIVDSNRNGNQKYYYLKEPKVIKKIITLLESE
jgi:DNA-binding transcriptional ArsR family regulator